MSREEERNQRWDTFSKMFGIATGAVSLVTACLVFFMFDYKKKAEENVQAVLETTSKTLDLISKSAFRTQSESELSVTRVSHGGRSGCLVTWSVSITNAGSRDVKVTRQRLKLYRGGFRDAGGILLGPLNRPGSTGAMEWKSLGCEVYTSDAGPGDQDCRVSTGATALTTDDGLDGYAAVGPMSPGDRRYAELKFVVEGSTNTWVYATAVISLLSEGQPDTLAEWQDRRILSDCASEEGAVTTSGRKSKARTTTPVQLEAHR